MLSAAPAIAPRFGTKQFGVFAHFCYADQFVLEARRGLCLNRRYMSSVLRLLSIEIKTEHSTVTDWEDFQVYATISSGAINPREALLCC
jgi:hypothetical protein